MAIPGRLCIRPSLASSDVASSPALEPEHERAACGKPQAALMLFWLPKCNSMRTRPGRVEPEIYFRIVRLAQNAQSNARANTYREQTVEIALGPKGAFENGNIGALTHRVPGDRTVSAVLQMRGNPIPPKEPKTPRVVELLQKAIEWRRQLDASEVRNQTEIARREGITRARITQVMGMLRLAPEIQQQILSTPDVDGRPLVTERMLRPIEVITDRGDQVREFHRFQA